MASDNKIEIGKMSVEIILPRENISKEIIIPKLSHGNRVIEVKNGDEDLVDCDGVFTRERDFVLGVTTADCAAVCIIDAQSIGVVHVGWRGLCLEVVENMLAKFDISKTEVYVAPFLHSFQIKKDFCYDTVVKKFSTEFFDENENEIIFRFKDALASLLPSETIFDERSTETSLDFPSYRRDGTKERMITTVQFVKHA